MYDGRRRQNLELQRQQQAQLAEGAKSAQVSAAMRELASKDRKHRLHALLWAFTDWRGRRRGSATTESRSWDH
jgi:hypothetical protein